MSEGLINALIVLFCVAAQGFFSGAEMIILSADRIKLRRESARGSKGAARAVRMLENSEWFLAITTTGTNLFVIIASAISAAWFDRLMGSDSELLAIAAISPVFLMFGEIIPRSVFQQRATEIAPKISRAFLAASHVVAPAAFLFFKTGAFFFRRVADASIARRSFVTRDDLEMILDVGERESELEKKDKALIRRVFRLGKSSVSDIMAPLVHVAALGVDATVFEARELIKKTGYSRIPVFRNRIDDLFGVVFAFDLIGARDPDEAVGRLARRVPFAPETKRADALLVSLQKSGDSMAIVVDEYGGAVGIITIEDILEEVVGEIRDEHDRDSGRVSRLGPGRFMAPAGAEVDEINESTGLRLPREDYETLGGFILKKTGKIPREGETFSLNGAEFSIVKADRRKIREVKIRVKPDESK
ncbi:conserved membrane hypothetical protein [Candidatus Desulfarcum epimagneticum]|uniref:HlyC/CorC family transporter n=1 Tax=uncultured Desulfobacteraceae bacterium TaxID=218296 RepID=A0A484HCT1_9BACT|nr:conserved membrane hypothetical protein [uncultured Desulfobacteraceae bacterium]